MSARVENSVDEHVLRTPVGRDLLDLFDRLTRKLPWRLNTRPFPVIVLEPEGATADTGAYLKALEGAADKAAIPYISPELGSEVAEPALSAITLLETMAQRRTWNGRRSHLGDFRFPRSELVASFERAVPDIPEGEAGPAPHERSTASTAAWNEQAHLFPWKGRRAKVPTWWAPVILFVASILGGIGGALAEQTPRLILLAIAAGLIALLLVVLALTTRPIWLWLATRLAFGSRYRWFATSSFFAVLGGDGLDGRLRRVFDQLVIDEKAEFRLQMKTFAFLEDLRDNYRKRSLSLRGFKRSVPPVVFLRGITASNGGVELLSAMSDIRSRRSELHPLLVVASVDSAHHEDLATLLTMREPPPSAGEGGESLLQLFDRWTGRLGMTQAPSQHVAHPWLLSLPIRHEPAGEGPDPALAYRHRPRWTWVWSLRGLAATVVVLILVAGYAHKHLRASYCRVGIIPVSWNSDTRWSTGADRECIGVATGGVRFESGPGSIGLDGNLRAPDPSHRGGQITLADLQDKIEMANADVLDSKKPYVTVLYAGILTAPADRRDLAVDGLKELAGAYLAQLRNNGLSQPGQIGSPLRIRLFPVNVGQDMAFSVDAADRILDIARRDRSVVGVVGMARNTENSQAAIRRLNAAGLPVISTLNSSDELPTLPHYYGLAATDHDETAALRPAVERELGSRRVDHALIVSREPGPSRDVYGREIAADAERALDPRLTDHVRYVDTDDVSDRVKAACESAAARPYTLVYFGGRREDMRGLIDGLSKGGCTQRGLVLLAGDEVATVRFGTEPHEVPLPASITVYYTAFAYLPNLIADHRDQEHAFFLLARNLLGIGAPRARGDEPLFVDGQMALAYDATSALAEASHNVFDTFGLTRNAAVQVPGSGAVTSGAVLLELSRLQWPDGATGAVVFRDAGNARQHTMNGPGNRGLSLVRVALDENGEPESGAICGRLNGGRPVPGLPACPR